jgi:hypothetical protein
MPTRSELARVHIAKRDLKLSDSLYRDFLQLWFNKRSAKNLNPEQIEELLTHFKGLGWGQVRSAPLEPEMASPLSSIKFSRCGWPAPECVLKLPPLLGIF